MRAKVVPRREGEGRERRTDAWLDVHAKPRASNVLIARLTDPRPLRCWLTPIDSSLNLPIANTDTRGETDGRRIEWPAAAVQDAAVAVWEGMHEKDGARKPAGPSFEGALSRGSATMGMPPGRTSSRLAFGEYGWVGGGA